MNYSIYWEGKKPKGIRNEDKFVVLFPDVSRYPGQEERYERELRQQSDMAMYLLKMLGNWGTIVEITVSPANLSGSQSFGIVRDIGTEEYLYICGPFEDKKGVSAKSIAENTATRWAQKFGYAVGKVSVWEERMDQI